MIILLGSSSGIGKKLLGQLSKIDEILALYNYNKPDINISNVYLEKIDITKIEQIQNIIEKYNSKLTKITFINLVATTLDKLVPDINKEDVNNIFKLYFPGTSLVVQVTLPEGESIVIPSETEVLNSVLNIGASL